MDVQTITMDPAEARERLEAYRAALRRSADTEYDAAVAGYEALAAGTPVLQYGAAITGAPLDEKGRPKLAVARADRKQVAFEWNRQTGTFSTAHRNAPHIQAGSLLELQVDMRRLCPRETPWGRHTTRGFALVPMIPPHAVAAAGGRSKLSGHLVLWEVEDWADQRIGAVPDRDPYLLRPIHGDLCAVVAEWDLTALERAVMAGRAFA